MEACNQCIERNRLKDDLTANGSSVSDERAEKCPTGKYSLQTPVNDEPNAERNRNQWLKKVQGVDVLHGGSRNSRFDD